MLHGHLCDPLPCYGFFALCLVTSDCIAGSLFPCSIVSILSALFCCRLLPHHALAACIFLVFAVLPGFSSSLGLLHALSCCWLLRHFPALCAFLPTTWLHSAFYYASSLPVLMPWAFPASYAFSILTPSTLYGFCYRALLPLSVAGAVSLILYLCRRCYPSLPHCVYLSICLPPFLSPCLSSRRSLFSRFCTVPVLYTIFYLHICYCACATFCNFKFAPCVF